MRRAELLLLVLAVPGAARAQEKKDAVAAVSSPTPAETKAVPLPDPPAPLAKVLSVYEKEPAQERELKSLYATALYYLLERDLERYALCFHKDYELEENGSVTRLPLAEHRARVKALWEKVPKSSLRVDELVRL